MEINMSDFMIRFCMSNLYISVIIGMFWLARLMFKNTLSNRMKYNLWFLLFGILAVPFIPFRLIGFPQILSWLHRVINNHVSITSISPTGSAGNNLVKNFDWINDISFSINSKTPPIIGYLLFSIWLTGIFSMLLLLLKSYLHLRRIEKSALPLQNQNIHRLYQQCIDETGIDSKIPIYSTAFLRSPMITGLLKPCIYLPIHLISNNNETDIHFMLLHELQHYKHRDAITNVLMNLAGIVYWFNPIVWYALKEMRTDREIACDTSVLDMLDENVYEAYGNTLINFAEKISRIPFPFAAGLGGNKKQIQRRIINIASYEKPTTAKKLKGLTASALIVILIFALTPFISTYASNQSYYQWDSKKNVTYPDLSSYFEKYQGCFVFYDLEQDIWSIYNKDKSLLRVSPNSTYKIYNALFGLEDHIISPDHSMLAWNGEIYPFESWNANQDLPSAIHNSVNWYFQEIDDQLGIPEISRYLHQIKYGNENTNNDLSNYWMEASLAISPIEQVELLVKLQNNTLGFTLENVNAVKDALRLSASDVGTLYGKTGTGRVNGKDVNGWFIGYIEKSEHTYFFAANIESEHNATGVNAAEISFAILSDMNVWK